MLKSHVVDIDGTFVGAAVRLPNGYKFVAVDVSVWSTLAELLRTVRGAFFSGRVPAPSRALAMPQLA